MAIDRRSSDMTPSTSEERRQQLLPIFLAEARDLLDVVHAALTVLATSPSDEEALREAFGSLHTLKGGAATMLIAPIVPAIDDGETLLERVGAAHAALTRPEHTVLRALENVLRDAIDTLDRDDGSPIVLPASLLDALHVAAAGTLTTAPDIISRVEAQVVGLDETPAAPASAPLTLTRNLAHIDLGGVDESLALLDQSARARSVMERETTEMRVLLEESRRNNARLRAVIDRLVTSPSAVNESSAAEMLFALGEVMDDQDEIASLMTEHVERASHVLSDDHTIGERLQQRVLSLRLVQLSSLETRLDQVILMTARALGKSVSWTLKGGSIAVDKAVLDALHEPLLHLLRNAVDHGVEEPRERLKAGKNSVGTITVEALYGVSSVIIRLSDDGRGIDPEAVAAAAVARGLISMAEASMLTRDQKFDLIWMPGLSTASGLTSISGRGIGMDVVRAALARVRGEATVESTLGQGTTFTLTVPLSLAVVRTLVLRDGEATAAIPVMQVAGVHHVAAEAVTHHGNGIPAAATVEGRTITLLAQRLASPIALSTPRDRSSFTIVEIRLGTERGAAFIVDAVVGEQETVVAPLPWYLSRNETFIGASTDRDGRPYAIIDAQILAAREGFGLTMTDDIGSTDLVMGVQDGTPETRAPLVLVVDDSLVMRRSLTRVYTSGGFRVETAATAAEALEMIEQEGMPMLLSLDMELPRMSGLDFLAQVREQPGGKKLPVIVVTARGGRGRDAAVAAGVTHYLAKPYNPDALIAIARDICGLPTQGDGAHARF